MSIARSLHINFREIRRITNKKLKHIKTLAGDGASQSELQSLICLLELELEPLVAEEARLKSIAELRDNFNAQFPQDLASRFTGERLMIHIVNHLAEQGEFAAVDRLIQQIPLLEQLSDVDLYREMYNLVESFANQDYKLLLDWCKRRRHFLVKGGSDIEMNLKLLCLHKCPEEVDETEFLDTLIKSPKILPNVSMGLVMRAMTGPLYADKTEDWVTVPENELKQLITPDDIKNAFKIVHKLPTQPLFNFMMLGASLSRSSDCVLPTGEEENPKLEINSRVTKSKIRKFLHVKRSCVTCQPWMNPVTMNVPLPSLFSTSMQNLVQTPQGAVIDYTILEAYMEALWPDRWKQKLFVDVDGKVHSVDVLKTVYAI